MMSDICRVSLDESNYDFDRGEYHYVPTGVEDIDFSQCLFKKSDLIKEVDAVVKDAISSQDEYLHKGVSLTKEALLTQISKMERFYKELDSIDERLTNYDTLDRDEKDTLEEDICGIFEVDSGDGLYLEDRFSKGEVLTVHIGSLAEVGEIAFKRLVSRFY